MMYLNVNLSLWMSSDWLVPLGLFILGCMSLIGSAFIDPEKDPKKEMLLKFIGLGLCTASVLIACVLGVDAINDIFAQRAKNVVPAITEVNTNLANQVIEQSTNISSTTEVNNVSTEMSDDIVSSEVEDSILDEEARNMKFDSGEDDEFDPEETS